MKATYLLYSDGTDSVSVGSRDLGEAVVSEAIVSIVRLVRRGLVPVLVVLKGGEGLKKAVDWAAENIDLLDEIEETLKVEVKSVRKETPPADTAGWEYEGVDFHS